MKIYTLKQPSDKIETPSKTVEYLEHDIKDMVLRLFGKG